MSDFIKHFDGPQRLFSGFSDRHFNHPTTSFRHQFILTSVLLLQTLTNHAENGAYMSRLTEAYRYTLIFDPASLILALAQLLSCSLVFCSSSTCFQYSVSFRGPISLTFLISFHLDPTVRVFHAQDNRPQSAVAPRPGDWRCASCNVNNFAKNDSCYKCQAAKSAAAKSSAPPPPPQPLAKLPQPKLSEQASIAAVPALAPAPASAPAAAPRQAAAPSWAGAKPAVASSSASAAASSSASAAVAESPFATRVEPSAASASASAAASSKEEAVDSQPSQPQGPAAPLIVHATRANLPAIAAKAAPAARLEPVFQMESNMYLMSIDKSKVIYRYDVVIEPELKQKVHLRFVSRKMPHSRCSGFFALAFS